MKRFHWSVPRFVSPECGKKTMGIVTMTKLPYRFFPFCELNAEKYTNNGKNKISISSNTINLICEISLQRLYSLNTSAFQESSLRQKQEWSNVSLLVTCLEPFDAYFCIGCICIWRSFLLPRFLLWRTVIWFKTFLHQFLLRFDYGICVRIFKMFWG